MRILLTNDDGINAPGLEVLIEIATELAGPEGEVWVVAPAFEQSGVGHCISYTHPTMVVQQGERRFATEGSPADCVLAALYDVMAGNPPDLVLSGVNRGNNSGENALYSGTLGAAIEAALQGVPAIALSQFMGPRTRDLANPFDSARQHGVSVIRKLLAHGVWDEGESYRLFYSVNFPPCSGEETKGMRAAAQGRRPSTNFAVEPHLSPSGRRFLWIKGGAQDIASDPGTDVAVNLEDYISITPMRCDLTAHDRLADLAKRLA